MDFDAEIADALASLTIGNDVQELCRKAEYLAYVLRSQLELDPQLHHMANDLFEQSQKVRGAT